MALLAKKGWLKSLPLKHDLAFMNSHIRDCAIRLLAYCKVTNSDWKRQFFFLTIFFAKNQIHEVKKHLLTFSTVLR